MKEKRGFNLRSFTSFALIISTVVMSWSGFILYVAPPGRIANWTNWQFMLFTKAEWQALHTIFSYLFFILFVIHLFFVNWKTFLTYIKSKIRSGVNRKWELVSAIIISAVFFIGTLKSWTPFGPVMSFGEKVKESWDNKKYNSPPVAHMEEYDLQKLSAGFPGISPVQLEDALKEKGYKTDGIYTTLAQLAKINGVMPADLYNALSEKFRRDTATDLKEAPSGVGRMTLNEISSRLGKPVSELVAKLGEKNVKAAPESTMKALSDQLGISPHDLYAMLSGK